MSVFGDIWNVATTGGDLVREAKEIGHHLPIGPAFGVAEGMYHQTEAGEWENAGIKDRAALEYADSGYSYTKALPVVGTALGVGEMLGGAYGLAGGLSRGDGAKALLHDTAAGMDGVKDHVMDVGAKVPGIGPWLYGEGLDSWGAHSALRKQVDERDPYLDERVKQEQKQREGL